MRTLAAISYDSGNLNLPCAREKEELNRIKLKKQSCGYLTPRNHDWVLAENRGLQLGFWEISMADTQEKVP